MSNPSKEWSGFYAKSVSKRQLQLCSKFELDSTVCNSGGLSVDQADLMVENCVGVLNLPLAVCPNVLVNNTNYTVPMCIEEPSVVAAASSACKLVHEAGGFICSSTGNCMTAQIQLVDIDDVRKARQTIEENTTYIINMANEFCPSMVNRGGGVVSIAFESVVHPGWLVVLVNIDVCEAMGANIVNTVAEGISPLLVRLCGGHSRAALRIVTNLCVDRMTTSSFSIPFESLEWKGVPGQRVANLIVEAYDLAVSSPFRATTHNKGIMNAIDAVSIATGQDWRAIEAGAHAYACKNGSYQSLTTYDIDLKKKVLNASLTLPIAVGTKGGSIAAHPTYNLSSKLLGYPNSQTLAQVIVSMGLAQNFAALRALTVEGIQKGHMHLHARNIAVSAGVSVDMVPEVAQYMRLTGEITVSAARNYVDGAQRSPCRL